MARAHGVPKSLTLKYHQSNESYGGKGEEEQEGEHQELQDLDPRGSPHIEEKVIGGSVNLDLLPLFPQKLVRIHGGSES